MKNTTNGMEMNRGIIGHGNASMASQLSQQWGNRPVHRNTDFMGLVRGVLRDAKKPGHIFNDGEWLLLQMWWSSASNDPAYCCELGPRFSEYNNMLAVNPIYKLGTNPDRWVSTTHAITGEQVGILFGESDEIKRMSLVRRLCSNSKVKDDMLYNLEYKYEGSEKIFNFSATGKKLFECLRKYVHWFFPGATPHEVRVTTSAIVSMWAIQHIDPALRTREEMDKYQRACQNIVTKAISGDLLQRKLVEVAIGAYLYLIMSRREDQDVGKNTLRVLDRTPTEVELQEYESTWHTQPITEWDSNPSRTLSQLYVVERKLSF
jgi:hypothetical protein